MVGYLLNWSHFLPTCQSKLKFMSKEGIWDTLCGRDEKLTSTEKDNRYKPYHSFGTSRQLARFSFRN